MRTLSWIVGLCCLVLTAGNVAHARDLTDMSDSELKALQQRLSDGGCYKGDIDGKPSGALQTAVKSCPSQDPVLRIETGMHVAPIRRISVDRACRIAATASWDKTVRVWSLPDGRLLRTLRVPIGSGILGRVSAVAVSPDGRWIAAGGWDAHWEIAKEMYVYVFDAVTGTIVSRVGPFESVTLHLAFSPDSRWLASTVAGVGLKLADTSTWHVVSEDKSYTGDAFGVTFGPNGDVYTAAFDGKLRHYGPGPSFSKKGSVNTKGGKQPFSVAVDPQGKLVATGFNDSMAVEAYDATTLDFRFSADSKITDSNSDIGKVTWSSDGSRLVVGGGYQMLTGGAWKDPILSFDRNGQRLGELVPLANDTIMNLQPCGNAVAVAASDPAFGLVDANGHIGPWKTGVAPDMRDKLADAFTISANAKQVRFGLEDRGGDPVLFDLGDSNVTSSPDPQQGFIKPVIEGLPVTDWLNNYTPKFDGKPIAMAQYEFARALAIRPDKAGFVLGTEYWLRGFDKNGKQLWQQSVPSVAYGVNISADGRLIVAAYNDGTIRWHRWFDGQELLALFVNRKTKAWVAWTPSGYYMASPGGEDLIGWHVNRGWSDAADFFPASQFRDKYARADIVEKILDTLNEPEAIRLAGNARPRKVEPAPIIQTLPPVLSILSPADESKTDAPSVTVDYLLRSPSGTPIDAVEALINGQPAGSHSSGDIADLKRCIEETHGLGRSMGALQGCRGNLNITLAAGTTEISVIARAGDKTSDPAKIKVTRTAPSGGVVDAGPKPKLYALVAGISQYNNPAYKLEFAAKDAHDFAGALANQNGGLYAEVDIKLIVDQKATAAAIKDGLDWLTHQVTEHDVGIVYLAGHGIVDERNRFYFMAADSDADRLRATAVAKDDISDALDGLAGKAVLFLDACHAGSMFGTGRRSAFDNNGVVNDFLHSERGVVVFAASTGRQVSVEDESWGNGAFTKALVEGLGSPGVPARASFAGDDTITPALLDAYVAKRVKDLTAGKQSPVMNSTAPDFPLAVVRSTGNGK